jgi:hypothetical protein
LALVIFSLEATVVVGVPLFNRPNCKHKIGKIKNLNKKSFILHSIKNLGHQRKYENGVVNIERDHKIGIQMKKSKKFKEQTVFII